MPAAARPLGKLDRTLLALSDSTRRRLIERLTRKPQRPTDLTRGLPISRPAVSRHLRVLRTAGLVKAIPQGREMLYGLAEDSRALEEARAYLERMIRGWDGALAAFKRFAEAEDDA